MQKDEPIFFDNKIYLEKEINTKPLGLAQLVQSSFRWKKRKNIEREKHETKKIQNTTRNTSLIQTILRLTKNRDKEIRLGQKQKWQNQLTSILPIVKIKMNSYVIEKSENELSYKKMNSFTSQFHNGRKGNTKQELPRQSENLLMIQKKLLNQIDLKVSDRYEFPKFSQKHEDISKITRMSQPVIQYSRQQSTHLVKLPIKSPPSNESKKLIPKQREQTYLDFINLVNWTNNMYHKYELSPPYKVFINKGNNHILVKNTFRKRNWWNIIQTYNETTDELNFYWTQNKNSRFINKIPITSNNNNNNTNNNNINSNINIKQKYLQSKIIQKNFQFFQLSAETKKIVPEEDLMYFNKFQTKEKEKKKLEKFSFYENSKYIKCHNHLEFHWHLSNKKMLFRNLKQYYIKVKKDLFENIPVTFHVKQEGDEQWIKFVEYFEKRKILLTKQEQNNVKGEEKNVWIIKPGQNTNRGNGIDVVNSIEEVENIISKQNKKNNKKNTRRTFIIQMYITPFLFHRRKFDIRCYVLLTSVNKKLKGYWYQDGYIRTSCKEFNLKNLNNKMIHLTNDAIQKYSEDYGKYEAGNKVSFADFQKYLNNSITNQKFNFKQTILPRMQELAKDAISSAANMLDRNSREYTFEIFGLDFLIDQNFKVWLIEINTNPCLEISSSLLGDIIPKMIQNAFKIALDPIFPPPKEFLTTTKSKQFQNGEMNNKFTLIFNAEKTSDYFSNNPTTTPEPDKQQPDQEIFDDNDEDKQDLMKQYKDKSTQQQNVQYNNQNISNLQKNMIDKKSIYVIQQEKS